MSELDLKALMQKRALDRLKKETFVIRDEVAIPERLLTFAVGKKYFIRTYGCQANVRDEETMKGLLEKAGFTEAENYQDADVIILNTCAVRENAENKVFGELGSLKGLKSSKKDLVIALGGCMPSQGNVVETINKKYNHVDLVFSTHNIHHLLEMLDEVYGEQKKIRAVEGTQTDIIENLPTKRASRFKAFVNIMFGCDKFCTYCIVPYTRGKERSRRLDDVLEECAELVQEGYQEITLLGQNVNAYGQDLNDGTTFATLLNKVADLGIPRLRFMTSHPWNFTEEMLDTIAKRDNIMKSIHLPFQSGSNYILRKMGRRYSREGYLALVESMKKKIPGLVLTTDIIVGFPNETEDQFIETLTLVEKVGFDGCYTFIYSPRKGTPAALMNDTVTPNEKSARFNRLVEVVEKEAIKKADAMVGQTVKVLVDGVSKKDANRLSGYSETGKLVHFNGDEALLGQIVSVKINKSHLYSFLGDLVHE